MNPTVSSLLLKEVNGVFLTAETVPFVRSSASNITDVLEKGGGKIGKFMKQNKPKSTG